MMTGTPSAWAHALRVVRPALLLMPTDWLDEVASRLRAAGIQAAVARHDSGPVIDLVVAMAARAGVSNAAADSYAATHGALTWAAVSAALATGPSCPRLRSYWHYAGCRYTKISGTCGSPRHLPACPVPAHDLRKGLLNEGGFGLALFVRDVCGGDLVSWLDARLATADPGLGVPGRGVALRDAVLLPLTNVHGLGPKVLSMTLAELLLVGDPERERWRAAGAAMVAVDSLVHAHLQRAGILRRLVAEHPYGPACVGPRGCVAVVQGLAERIDARAFGAGHPAVFPRFLQSALWRFAATGLHNVCNGRRIDDRGRCGQVLRCPSYLICDRVALG